MTRTEPAPAAGIALHTQNPADRVALRGVRLRSRLAGMSQRTTVEQTFVNLEGRAIEAVYTFPLPESAAVCGFEVVTADRVLTGKIEEAERAVEQYEEAVSSGHGAFMMEQDRPDVFTVRVGNLKPRQAATIRLTYVCPLEKADKSIRVAYPTAVAPRYATATATDPLEAVLDGDALNPPHVLSVPYGLTMEVEVDLGRELKGVTSPSHAVRVGQTEAGTALVTLTAGVTEMNRDIVLTVALAKEHQPTVQSARGTGGESYLSVTFVPELDEDDLADPQPVETAFVLDCSGSMQGDSIAQATAALELCLRSLSPGDTFNICRFGSTFQLMASEPLPYTQETLDRAIRYVRQGADLGGTELYPPLEAILAEKPRAGSVRQVILLTDGQVSNEPAVVELARQHRRHNRIFSFGIGSAASSFLVKGVARATGGAAEFITGGERIDDKVLRTFARLASPMVGDVSIDWDGAEVQTLAELPPVFDGDVLAVFGRAPGKLPKHVTLSCTTPAGPKRWTLAVPPPLEDGGVIANMWARRTIQSLEEVNNLRTVRMRKAKLTREQETLVNLSKEFGLLCSLTTFIAVEHRSVAERNDGQPELRRVPVQLAKGWGGVQAAFAPLVAAAPAYLARSLGASMSPPSPAAAMSPAPPSELEEELLACDLGLDAGSGMLDLTRESGDTSLGAVLDEISPAPPPPSQSPRKPSAPAGPPAKAGRILGTLRGLVGGGAAKQRAKDDAAYAAKDAAARETKKKGSYESRDLRDSRREKAAGPPASAPPVGNPAVAGNRARAADEDRGTGGDDLHDILSLQTADGWFDLNDRMGSFLQAAHGRNWRATVETALPAGKLPVPREQVVQTILVVLLLERLFADREPLWRRARRKAVRQFLANALVKSPTEVETWLKDVAGRV